MPVQDLSPIRADLRAVGQSVDRAETECAPTPSDSAQCGEALQQVGDAFRRFNTDYRTLSPDQRAGPDAEIQNAIAGQQLRTFKLLDLMRIGSADPALRESGFSAFQSATAAGVAVRPEDFQTSLKGLGSANEAVKGALQSGSGVDVALARLKIQLELGQESFAALNPDAQAAVRGQYERTLLDIGNVVTSREAVALIGDSTGDTLAEIARLAATALKGG